MEEPEPIVTCTATNCLRRWSFAGLLQTSRDAETEDFQASGGCKRHGFRKTKRSNMMQTNKPVLLWRQFTLREAILLGFCATFIILARAGLRLHLHLPGHVMFFTMFFYLMARGCVPKIGSATLVGLIVSLASLLLGMGTKGPVVFAKFLLPALLVDIAGYIFPAFVNNMVACALVGAVAAATRSLTDTWIEWLSGMEGEVILQKTVITASLFAFYAGLSSLAVPPIIRRLRSNGLIDQGAGETR